MHNCNYVHILDHDIAFEWLKKKKNPVLWIILSVLKSGVNQAHLIQIHVMFTMLI